MLLVTALLLAAAAASGASAQNPRPCKSLVYCIGPLLKTVQLSEAFNDSKIFVDMKMKDSYSATLEKYNKLMQATDNQPSKAEVLAFVNENFEDGDELTTWVPPDYMDEPKFLKRIADPVVENFARQLIELWPQLARRVKSGVATNPTNYSFIPVPNGFIIPGGRFREYYYWDTYWIVEGLLVSEMDETARGMIENLIHLVRIYGYIPNGGRIYYLGRSHPPLLTKMVMAYYKYTKDRRWLKENIEFVSQEVRFWLDYRTTQVIKNDKMYIMAHYSTNGSGPRPESYIKDYTSAEFYPDSEDKNVLYNELKSAAESGWDFSSRWLFDDEGGNEANLTFIQTSRVIPVDLNAYLCEAFGSLSFLYSQLSDHINTMYWRKMAIYWQTSIEDVMWDNEDGTWYDYDNKLSRPRKYFYPSNIAPLWSNCFDKHKAQVLGKRTVKYLSQTGALNPPGGIPTSFNKTGQQWDLPNAWSPLQAIVIQGLEKVQSPLAKNLARKWVSANIRGFISSGEMFEKYDVCRPGRFGGGGEYPVQSGFGWSNAVALKFIHKYFSGTKVKVQ